MPDDEAAKRLARMPWGEELAGIWVAWCIDCPWQAQASSPVLIASMRLKHALAHVETAP